MSIFFRFVSIFLIFSLAVASPQGALTLSAANVSNFDPTARLVAQSQPFKPLVLCGVRLQDNDPFKLEFIVDEGDTHFNEQQFKEEVSRCIRYFLTGIVVPEKDLWVNLSPQEQNRIIPGGFGVTELGRDLLAQDLFLKEISASLTYPQSESGKAYWNIARSNQADNNQQRVWIVPRAAAVAEDKNSAFVADSQLRAMTEDDYLTRAKTLPPSKGSLAFRQHILPLIEQDVNSGKNFAALRQAYNSLILATWFKIRLKESILAQAYADKNVTRGVDIKDPNEKEKIYQQYLEAFKRGAYDYVQRERVSFNHIVKRRYFSGGMDFAGGISSILHMTPAAGRWSSLIPARGKRVLVGLAALVALESTRPAIVNAQGDSEHALHRQNTPHITYDPANQDAVKIVDLSDEGTIGRLFPSEQDPFKVISSAPVIAVGTGAYDDGHGAKTVEIKIVRVENDTAGGYLAFADVYAKKPVIYFDWNAAVYEGALKTAGAVLRQQGSYEYWLRRILYKRGLNYDATNEIFDKLRLPRNNGRTMPYLNQVLRLNQPFGESDKLDAETRARFPGYTEEDFKAIEEMLAEMENLRGHNEFEEAAKEGKFRKFLRGDKGDGEMAISFAVGQLSHEVEHIQRKAAGKPVVDHTIFAELADYNYNSKINDEDMSYIIEEISAYLRQITIEPRLQLERMITIQGHGGSRWVYGVTAKFIVRHMLEALGFDEFVKTHHP